MAEDDKKRKKIDLDALAVKDAKPQPKYADLAKAPTASEWQPGKKLFLSRFPPVPMSADLERVLALPRRPQLDLESDRARAMADMMTKRWSRGERECRCGEIDVKIKAGKRKCLKYLLPVQAWALYEMGITGGLLGSIPVGSGKTAIGLLAPLALAPLGIERSILLVPPNLLKQLHRDYQLLREHFRVPELFIHGLEKRELAVGEPKLHVIPYSRLSMPKASSWVRELAPQAIIADECDRLRDPNGAGCSRVLRYFMEHGDTLFCGWTGSLTESGIGDYAHLAALALRMESPLPIDRAVVVQWGRALDESENPGPPGELGQLCAVDERLDPESTEDVREGYRRRLTETMGIVVSTVASVDAELVITRRDVDVIPDIIHEALHKVRACWVRPDTLVGSEFDEELTDAFQVAKVARELASGVFYRWKFPPINGVPQSREVIKAWYEARRDYNRELRYRLSDREEWLDSPHLCELAAQRHWGDRPKRPDRPEWESQHWPRWRDIKDKVRHEQEACRVSDYLVKDAAAWALSNLGIVWYGMREFGQWVAELSGLPLHTGGPKAEEMLEKEVGDRSIIASISSHGRGRDGLQALYCNQLVAQIPSSNSRWEQLIGRLHRQGQDKGEVRAEYYGHTDELADAFETALRRAGYVGGTIGGQPKVLSGYRTR